jgi:Raf kinase inhibitor-like YbhB/YbcL family protein
MNWRVSFVLASAALLAGPTMVLVGAQTQPAKIVVTSPKLESGEPMPRDYTPDGRNVSPPLSWSGLPAGTKELAVVCADFGAGAPPPWVHWIIYNIPATAKGLPEELPIDPASPMPVEIKGAAQGLNSWRRPIYRGPAPPVGTTHIYYFTVYALDADLDLKSNLTRTELLEAMEGHIIGRGELVPTFERRPVKAAP